MLRAPPYTPALMLRAPPKPKPVWRAPPCNESMFKPVNVANRGPPIQADRINLNFKEDYK